MKKRNNQVDEFQKIRMPKKEEHELLAIVTKMHGTNQLKAMCSDGIERSVRITGKMKKRVWIRENDLIIVKVWDFQPSKADVIWRFKGDYAINFFKKKKMLGKIEDFI